MPVVLDSGAYVEWLDHENLEVSNLQEVLSQSAIMEFVFYPVSKQVNAVRNNGPGNIEPVETHHVQGEFRYLVIPISGQTDS